MADYVQGGIFGGLNFQPLGWGAPTGPQPANPLPSLPSLPQLGAPSQTTAGNVVTSQGSASGLGGISAPPNGAPTNAVGTPSNASAGAQPQSTGSSWLPDWLSQGSIGDFFLRVLIVILGFIFVAIGLNMFKPGIVPNPVNAVRR